MSAAVEGQHILLAAFHPLDGTAEHDREVGNSYLFGEESSFLSKSSANVRGDYAYAVFLTVQQLDEVVANFVGVLGGVPDGEHVLLGLIVG